MKKFLEGFFGMIGLMLLLVGFPLGGGHLAEYFSYDAELGIMGGVALLVCIVTGLISWANDDEEKPMKYKVQVGDKEFECNSVSHEEDLETIILTMDGVESRVTFDTNILISDK